MRDQVTARTVDSHCCWDYTDVCAFLICVVTLGAFLRLAIVLHVLPALAVQEPTVLLQAVLCLCILLALYATLKLRHGGAVWRALGWTLPRCRYTFIASFGGALLAAAVILVVQAGGLRAPLVSGWTTAALAASVGPVLEESFFRGCVLPLVARNSGTPAAVILTALVFASFHKPPTVLHCVCFAVNGVVYGWIRVASGSTAAAALMHAAYNLTLFVHQKF